MRIREVPPKIGQQVILRHSYNSYFLPEKLKPGTTVKVLDLYYGSATVEQDGKTWRISERCIEHAYEYEVGNKWYPADHPLVAKEAAREEALRSALANEPNVTGLMT